VNTIGWTSGGWIRLTGSKGAVRPACRAILGLYGRRYGVQGDLPAGPPAVLVANRSGWLDPLVLAAILTGEIRFADRAALLGLSGPLRWLMEPIVLGHDRGRTVPASGELRDRIRHALNADQTVIAFPDSPVGEPASRSRYRLDPFQAAVEMGAPLIALSIRERAAQADSPERVRPRRVTMVIPRDPLPVDAPPDFHALRDRARATLGEYHA
jgi:1-acyl-sn-glycerol-3-phosphate acyltransferase